MSEKNKLIDLDKVIAEKLGTKSKYIPSFAKNWLKNFIHQDELNEFIQSEGDKQGVPWLWDCVRFLDMNLIVKGRENLPLKSDARHYVFVSNHPLGGQDGVALGAVLGQHFDGKIKYLVNDILMNLYGLAPLCVPINKMGKQSRNFPAMIEQTFLSDDAIIMFPAGLCSRKKNGVIRDLPWQKAFIKKCVETKRDVIPIFFGGSNSKRFYRIANMCERLGIRFNLALLLVDEMMKNRHKSFEIKIGKPILWQTFDHTKTAKQWAQYVKEQVYAL